MNFVFDIASFLQDNKCDNMMQLESSSLEELIYLNKRYTKAIEAHKAQCNYMITPPNPNSEDQRWKTWVKRSNEPRKKLAGKSELALFEKMYQYYFYKECETKTLNDIFKIWIKEREKEGLDPGTIRKDHDHYNKYYKGHPLMEKPIKTVVAKDITEFIDQTIVKFSLTKKTTHNIKIIIKNLCTQANILGLNNNLLFIPDSFKLGLCSNSRASLETNIERAIPPEIKSRIIKCLLEDHMRKPNYTPTLALLLDFQTGIRLGELSAIRIDHVNLDDRVIYIRMAENDFSHQVTSKLKTDSSIRDIPLNNSAYNYVKKAINAAMQSKDSSGYLFVNSKGQRHTSRSIAAKLERVCKKLGITSYSPHDIRRTVATEVYKKSSYGIDAVQGLLGHSSKAQSYDYIKDLITSEMTTDAVNVLDR